MYAYTDGQLGGLGARAHLVSEAGISSSAPRSRARCICIDSSEFGEGRFVCWRHAHVDTDGKLASTAEVADVRT